MVSIGEFAFLGAGSGKTGFFVGDDDSLFGDGDLDEDGVADLDVDGDDSDDDGVGERAEKDSRSFGTSIGTETAVDDGDSRAVGVAIFVAPEIGLAGAEAANF